MKRVVTIVNDADATDKKKIALTMDPETNKMTEAALEQPVRESQLWHVQPCGAGSIYVNLATDTVLQMEAVGEWRFGKSILHAVGGGSSKLTAGISVGP